MSVLVGVLASVVPAGQVFDLYSMPVGSGVRPMGAPFIFAIHGLGTPPFVIALVAIAFTFSDDAKDSLWSAGVLAAIALLLAFAPLLLSTVGLEWAISTRKLWLKP